LAFQDLTGLAKAAYIGRLGYIVTVWTVIECRDAPIMLENLSIIPSSTSQNLYLLFFIISPIIPKLFLIIILIILTILADFLNLSLMIKQKAYNDELSIEL